MLAAQRGHSMRVAGSQRHAAAGRITKVAFPSRPARQSLVARAETRSNSDGFVTGFVLGGAIFGALGFIFAPQISKALIGDDQRLKLPKFLEEEAKDPAQTKQELMEKIANLNASIDDVAAKLKTKEPEVAIEAKNLTTDLKKMLQL